VPLANLVAMQDEPETEAEIFKSFACEIAHLEHREAWRVLQAWLDRQRDRYRYHYRDASLAIWREYRRAHRIWLMTSTRPAHMRDQDSVAR
jgi:hypothetical protein